MEWTEFYKDFQNRKAVLTMDLRAMNAWKKFEQTGSIAAYMQYRQLLNNVDNGEENR